MKPFFVEKVIEECQGNHLSTLFEKLLNASIEKTLEKNCDFSDKKSDKYRWLISNDFSRTVNNFLIVSRIGFFYQDFIVMVSNTSTTLWSFISLLFD